MDWTWSGPDIVLAALTTLVSAVTGLVSLFISTIAAVLVALWIQRREFDRQLRERREDAAAEEHARRRAWRMQMADEAIVFCISISESAMAPGDGFKSIMVARWLDAFQARLRLGGDPEADHVAVQMRREWERAVQAGSRVVYASEEREDAFRGFILQLQEDLRLWGIGNLQSEFWVRR